VSDYDLFVIGAGSGGVAASRRAALHGARVGICEMGTLGGTCVNRGCIPKKLFAYAAHYSEAFREAVGFGWAEARPAFRWPDLVAAKDREIQRLNQVYEGLLEQGNVTLVRGRARLLDANTIDVDGARISAEHILLAAGARPFVPDIPGADLAFTSDEAFHLRTLPKRVVIVGGGYIALEFASIFRGLGAAVTVVHRSDAILRGFDDEVRAFLAEELRKKQIAFRPGRRLLRLGHKGDTILATIDNGEVLAADAVMFAMGRSPNTADLGLREIGVTIDERGAVAVDADSRTNVPSVFAIGDVTHRRNLTPVAIAEGRAVADLLYGGGGRRLDYSMVPTAVFSAPAAAAVGLSESEARARGHAVDIYTSSFRPLRHTLSGSDERALVKLVVEAASDRVLGAHMVGGDAAEVIQSLAVALTAGATKAQFDATIALHPSAAEEFMLLRTKAKAATA
jgi:glutathione reductase (NADPH)